MSAAFTNPIHGSGNAIGGWTSGAAPDSPDPAASRIRIEDHGHSAVSIASNVYNFLEANPADIVLLHIGTNDVSGGHASADDGRLILDEIDRYSPSVWVVLTLIINRATPPCALCTTTTVYNDALDAMVRTRLNDKIVIVDMETGAGMDYRLYPSGDMYDTVHPFASGYEKMAEAWLLGLLDILPTADAGTDQNVNPGDAVTLNGSGSPDVDGNPLTYQWSFVSVPPGSAASLSDPTAVRGRPRGGRRAPRRRIYSTFLQRGYDQEVHDVALQSAHVVLCMDRAGIVGGDGATANGAFDIAYLRTVPKTTLLAPADLPEMERMLKFALAHEGVVALRWPRANFRVASLPGNAGEIALGRSVRHREGEDLAIVAYGAVVPAALDAAEMLRAAGLEATVVNARFSKPLDVAALEDLATRHPLVVTVEDHALAGGFGSAVLEALGGPHGRIVRLGLPDRFVEHGSRDDLLKRYGLGAAQIAERCESEARRSSGAVN